MSVTRRAALALPAILLASRNTRAAQPIRLGLLRTVSPAPFYIAQSRGLFADPPVEFVFFEAAQPIAAAAVAGDIDVGVTALTGGFFSLAGRGALKVIGGALHERQGFHLTAILASNAAYATGLTSPDKLGGYSFGITQYGSSFHYMIGRIAGIEGFPLATVTLRPLQQVGNMVAAVRSGQVDATMAIASMAKPLADAGGARIIGWVGDILPYQITAMFATKRMIETRADDLRRFCAAYQQGIALYQNAFLYGAQGQDEAIGDITRYVLTGDPDAPSKIRDGIGWYDDGGALDVADVRAQLAWFAAEGMVKGTIDPGEIIDTRFLPTR